MVSDATAGNHGLQVRGLSGFEVLDGRGFGKVFRAVDEESGDPVAVKVLVGLGADEAVSARLEREMSRLSVLDGDPGVTPIRAWGTNGDGFAYVVMDHMPGGSLAAAMAPDARQPSGRVSQIGRAVAEALGRAHEHGVVHGDILPSRILLDATGAPRLTGFGESALRTGGATRTDSVSSRVSTVIPYAAPELIDGGAASTSSDVYSLGATLYGLLAGTAPFVDSADDSWMTVIGRVASGRPRHIPDADPELMRVVLTAMSKDPSDRYADGMAMAEALAGLAAGGAATSAATEIAANNAVESAGGALTELGTPPVDPHIGSAAAITELASGTVDDVTGANPEHALHTEDDVADRPPASRARAWIIAGGVVVVASLGIGIAAALGGPGDPAVTDDTLATDTSLPGTTLTEPSTTTVSLVVTETLRYPVSVLAGGSVAISTADAVPDAPPPEDASIAEAASFGLAEIDPTGDTITYTAPSGFPSRIDEFTVRMCYSGGTCVDVVITITIGHTRAERPVLEDDSTEAPAGQPIVIPVLANDGEGATPDPDTLSITRDPRLGTARVDASAGTVIYTADATAEGSDTFTYRVCSITDNDYCAQATVSITIVGEADATSTTTTGGGSGNPPATTATTAPTATTTTAATTTTTVAATTTTAPVAANRAPVANNHFFSFSPGETRCVSVVVGGEDPDGDSVTVVDVGGFGVGSASICGAGSISYTAAGTGGYSEIGVYTISDGAATSSGQITIQVP